MTCRSLRALTLALLTLLACSAASHAATITYDVVLNFASGANFTGTFTSDSSDPLYSHETPLTGVNGVLTGYTNASLSNLCGIHGCAGHDNINHVAGPNIQSNGLNLGTNNLTFFDDDGHQFGDSTNQILLSYSDADFPNLAILPEFSPVSSYPNSVDGGDLLISGSITREDVLATTPLPASLPLFSTALIGFAAFAWHRQKRLS